MILKMICQQCIALKKYIYIKEQQCNTKSKGRLRAPHTSSVKPQNRSAVTFSDSFQRAGEQIL